jgi:molybdopterin-guanine dinucleotide biosynthesis protein A
LSLSVDTRDVSGIILAGGKSARLGHNKALVDAAGRLLIERVIDRVQSVVDEIVLVTNCPDRFSFLDLPMTGDIYRGVGTLGGLHAGLRAVHGQYALTVGCDMPLLNVDLLRHIVSLRHGYDVVIPRVGEYTEPLHALYGRRCLPGIERAIEAGQRRVMRACDDVRVRYVTDGEIAAYDPRHLSFFNVNDADDLRTMEELLAAQSNG